MAQPHEAPIHTAGRPIRDGDGLILANRHVQIECREVAALL